MDPKVNVRNVAAGFQAAVVDTLVEKTIRAATENDVRRIVVAGGVAANSSLRTRMGEEATKRGMALHLPGMFYCIDNAAMIALAGYLRYKRGETSNLDLNPRPSMPL